MKIRKEPTINLPDGLYQVTTPYLCAGFLVERGRVTRCAPILQRNITHWLRRAERVTERDHFPTRVHLLKS
jgi:hypothetical protein